MILLSQNNRKLVYLENGKIHKKYLNEDCFYGELYIFQHKILKVYCPDVISVNLEEKTIILRREKLAENTFNYFNFWRFLQKMHNLYTPSYFKDTQWSDIYYSIDHVISNMNYIFSRNNIPLLTKEDVVLMKIYDKCSFNIIDLKLQNIAVSFSRGFLFIDPELFEFGSKYSGIVNFLATNKLTWGQKRDFLEWYWQENISLRLLYLHYKYYISLKYKNR